MAGRTTYVLSKIPDEDGYFKLIPKSEVPQAEASHLYIHGDIESFVSPITKEVISDRGQLRRHNAEHGVTNSADYSAEYIGKRAAARENEMIGNTTEAREERRSLIAHELQKNGY